MKEVIKMAKILISSLGTGKKENSGYKKTKYQMDDKTCYETSLIVDALAKHYEVDDIFLVGTKKSIWDEVYMLFGGEDDKYLEELYTKKDEGKITQDDLDLLNKTLSKGSKCFVVDYGINNEELWSNFETFLKISKHIENGDEILLDITHSFRSLSLMSFVMTQFTSSISDKEFTIQGVYYGMFEYSYESPEGITPVINIKILLEIQEWIKAIDAIKTYSDFDPLVRMLENDKSIEKNVKNSFVQLNNSIKMANLAAFEIFIKNASKKIKTISNSSNKIVKLLAPEIIKLVDNLNKEKKSMFQFTLAQWFYKNKNYAFSYLALYESIISKSCELKDYDVNNHELREEAKKSIGNDKYGQYFYTKKNNPSFANSISNIRNSIAHQNGDRQDNTLEDIKKLENYLNTFKEYIYQ
ncbi:MAG: TIGR02221 family CRISPR-associated protein [Sulfurimonas sp.]